MQIGFDLDGVIVDHTTQKIRLAAKQGFKLKPEQTPSDIIKQIIPPSFLHEIKRALYHDLKIAYLSPLMPGVKNNLAKIKRRKIPYFLISRRQDAKIAANLLKRRGLWPSYFNKNNSFFVLKPEDKNTKALELGITHYIDDELNVLERLADVENKFLFDKFNVFKDADYYARIQSWKELAKYLITR